MKTLYISSVILFICGLFLIIYLLPSSNDLALIQLKGREYSSASAYYKTQYDAGVRTPDEIHALENLELGKGNVKESIKILETYASQHPEEIQVYKRLAQLYRDNQQYEKYYETQQTILKAEPDNADALLELVFWYKNRNDPAYCPVLKKLVDLNLADAGHYIVLARCYAMHQDYNAVQRILEARRKKFSNQLQLYDFFFELWAIDQQGVESKGEMQNTIEALIAFIRKKNSPLLGYEAIGSIQGKYPEYAPYMIHQLEPLLQKQPAFASAALVTLWEFPNYQNEVFGKLVELYAGHGLNPQLQDLFLQALILKRLDSLMLEFIQSAQPEDFLDSTVYEFVQAALAHRKPFLIETLQKAYSPAYLNKKPLIGAFLALGLHAEDGPKKVEALMQRGELTSIEYFWLFQLAVAAGDSDLASKLGHHLPPFLGFNEDQLFQIAYSYFKLDQSQLIYEQLQKYFPSSISLAKESKASAAIALLHAVFKQPSKTEIWLKKQGFISKVILDGLYAMTEIQEEYPLQYDIAFRLYKEYPSSVNEASLAAALVHNGEAKKGLESLKGIVIKYPHEKELEQIYFQSLVFAAKHDSIFVADLARYMKGKTTQENMDAALAREYVSIYVDIVHDFPKAEQILQQLVDQGGANRSDIDQLISLIGARPCCKTIAWVVSQAANATQEEWGFWLEKLTYVGGFCEVIALFEERLQNATITDSEASSYFAYLESLAFLKKQFELKEAVNRALCSMHDEKNLQKLTLYAEEANDQAARKYICQLVASKHPNDPSSWQALATALFDQKDYCAATGALLRFFYFEKNSLTPNPTLYESLYQFAEILEVKWFHREAKRIYVLALSQIYSAPRKTKRMEEIASLIQFRLGCKGWALEITRELFEKSSRDPGYAASYVNMMMDAGAFDWAHEFIKQGAGH